MSARRAGRTGPARPYPWTAALALLAAVVVVAGLAAVVLLDRIPPRQIVPASRAGGLPLDRAAERRLAGPLAAQRDTLRQATGEQIGPIVTAVYAAGGDSATGRQRYLIFLGGTAPDLGDPAAAVAGFRAAARGAETRVIETDPGRGGGKGVCAESGPAGRRSTLCLWATETSVGMLVPTTAGTAAKTAELMRRMRPDLEK